MDKSAGVQTVDSNARKVGSVISVAVCAVLFAAAVLPPCPVRIHLFTIFSGLMPLLLLRRRWGAVSLLLLAAPVGLLLWSVLAVLLSSVTPSTLVLCPWIVAAMSLLILFYQRKRAPIIRLRPTPAEWFALVAGLVVTAVIAWISMRNGYVHCADGTTQLKLQPWLMDDTMYLCALAEQALIRGGWPTENPFMAGIANYYPSLMHCGLGSLSHVSGQNVFGAMCSWMATYGGLSAGLMILVCARIGGSIRKIRGAMWGVFAVGYYAVQHNEFILFPQTTFLVMPVLLLIAWLLFDFRGRRCALAAHDTALGIAILLAFSHIVSAVIGGILLGVATVFMVLRPMTRRAGLSRAGMLCVIIAIVAFFSWYPYSGVAGYDQYSHRTWQDFLSVYSLPCVLPIVICACGILFLHRRTTRLKFALLLIAIAGISTLYFLRGVYAVDSFSRWFALFNVPRFTQIGLLFLLPVFAFCTGKQRYIMTIVALLMLVASSWLPLRYMSNMFNPMRAPSTVLETSSTDGILNFLRTKTAVTDIVSGSERHIVAALSGRCEFLPDAENLWGMDTLPPSEFWRMQRDYDLLWRSDKMTTVTPAMRADAAKHNNIRWLVDMSGRKNIVEQMLARYPKDFVQPVMIRPPLALFCLNLDAATTATKEVTTHD